MALNVPRLIRGSIVDQLFELDSLGAGLLAVELPWVAKKCSLSGCSRRILEQDGGVCCEECESQMYCATKCAENHWPEHKLICKRLNYVLGIDLYPAGTQAHRPCRIMSCPANATLEVFHLALSSAFSLHANPTSYSFSIYKWPQTNLPLVCLGTFITAFGHYYRSFYTAIPQLYGKNSRQTTLSEVLGRHPTGLGKKVIHYENGINQQNSYVILLLEREAPTSQFVALWSGASRCPDYGWEALKLAYEASEPTKEQKELISLHEVPDISDIRDIKAINEALSMLPAF